MKYFGDIAEDATIEVPFNTNDSNGASVTFTGTTVKVYKDSATGTETVAGVTLSKDHDGITGVHLVTIDTSADAVYATGSNYYVQLQAATIDSQTVNAWVGAFSIENRPVILANKAHGGAAATITLKSVAVSNADGNAVTMTSTGTNGHGLSLQGDGSGEGVSATGGATGNGIQALGGAGGSPTQGILAQGGSGSFGSGIVAQALGTDGHGLRTIGEAAGNGITSTGGATGDGLNVVGGANGDGLSAAGQGTGVDIRGDITGTLDTVTDVTNPVSITDAAVDAVWDEPLSAASHDISTSSGRRLRQLTDVVTIDGTSPDTSGTTNTSILIELDGDASAVDGTYDPSTVCIVGGTGEGQCRQIWEYDGSNKLAYVNRDWKVVPDSTSEYIIIASSGNTHVNEGLARGGGATSITLNTLASADTDAYVDQVVFIAAGVGADQAAIVTAYNGTTKVATVDRTWATQPTTGSVYAILPLVTTNSALTTHDAKIGTPADIDSGGATIADNLKKMVDDNGGADFDATTDSLESIRDRGDSAWVGASVPAVDTTVATSDSTVSFTLTAGKTTNDAYNDMLITVTDADDSNIETRRIVDYTSGRVVTVDRAFSFTPAVADVVAIEKNYSPAVPPLF